MKTKILALTMLLGAMMMILTACGVNSASRTVKPAAIQVAQSQQNINQNEAVNAIKNMIQMDYTKYQINLINANLEYNGSDYYQFEISDEWASIEPSIIVSKSNGLILCYYPDNTVTEVYQDGVFKSKC